MRVLCALGLAFVILFAAACIIPVFFDPESGTWTPSLQKFHRVVSLGPGGTLSLENANGDVEIRGWDQEDVEITAEEDRGDNRERRRWRYYGMGDAQPHVQVDQFDQMIKIKAGSPEEENARPVHFVINVPHSINLTDIRINRGQVHIADVYGSARVELDEGDITLENFSGSLDLSLVRGSAEVEVLDLRKDDEVRITTKEGDITLFLQPEVSVRLEATASNGEISSEFDLGQQLPTKKVSAQIGRAEAAAFLMALNGDIRLKKIKSP
jgi:hypothetical protein